MDKYTSKEYICALKGYIYILPAILCIIVLSIMTMTGCSKNESKEHEVIDYTVVENADGTYTVTLPKTTETEKIGEGSVMILPANALYI